MNNSYTFDGRFNLILGPMWSGKTSELLKRYRRSVISNKKCVMIKYKNDTRYDNTMVVTHDGLKINALVCEYLVEVDKAVENYDVICIDEVQFYKDAHIFIDKWANSGKIIDACGLNGDFKRKCFNVISKLIPLADDIIYLRAICKETGNDAPYTGINIVVKDGVNEIIGGSELYSSMDRKTFYKNKSFYNIELITEYLNIYFDKCGLPTEVCQEYVPNFLNEISIDDVDFHSLGNKFLKYFSSTYYND